MTNQNDELMMLEQEMATRKREELENKINKQGNVWGHSITALEGKKAAMAMLSTKTGLYAKVPIICKGLDCPYAETCPLISNDLAVIGEPCSWETAIIETRYAGYMDDFGLDSSSFSDNTLVSELINLDVKLERQKALIAKEGISIVDVVAGITESGEQFTRPEISKAEELYEKTLNQKLKLMDKMLATRASRKGTEGTTDSITQMLQSAISTDEFIIEETPEEFRKDKN